MARKRKLTPVSAKLGHLEPLRGRARWRQIALRAEHLGELVTLEISRPLACAHDPKHTARYLPAADGDE